MAVDWALLWHNRVSRHLSLPSYPCLRERYWLRERPAGTEQALVEPETVATFEEVWQETPPTAGKHEPALF